jgi:hypothetical protein
MAAKQVAKYVPLAGQITAAALGASAMIYLGYQHIDERCRIVSESLAVKR